MRVLFLFWIQIQIFTQTDSKLLYKSFALHIYIWSPSEAGFWKGRRKRERECPRGQWEDKCEHNQNELNSIAEFKRWLSSHQSHKTGSNFSHVEDELGQRGNLPKWTITEFSYTILLLSNDPSSLLVQWIYGVFAQWLKVWERHKEKQRHRERDHENMNVYAMNGDWKHVYFKRKSVDPSSTLISSMDLAGV